LRKSIKHVAAELKNKTEQSREGGGTRFPKEESLPPVISSSYHVDMSRHMDAKKSQAAFAALAQPTRLKAFRKLVAAHPQGLPAGEIAQFCKVPHNTMSTHLAALMRGGLIAVTREGRSMNYRANLDGFRGLIDFMLRDCCGGRPEICAPVVDDFAASCCAPARKETVNG
jgi:ArsR family transcriptional regulator